jgi:hypothetical protein
VPVVALLALGLDTDSGSASIRTPETTPRSGGVPGAPLKDSIGFRRLVMRALPPAIASVHTPTTLDLGVDPRASPPGTAPVGPGDPSHMGEGMARTLDLALEIDSGVKQRG